MVGKMSRRAKPASHWTLRDLASYKITIVDQDSQLFFGRPSNHKNSWQRQHHWPTNFMATRDRVGARDEESAQLLHFLDLAHIPGTYETATDTFAIKLLEKLKYNNNKKIVIGQHRLNLAICHTNHLTIPNICIMDDDGIICLVQQNKSVRNDADPVAQVVAQAIAVFQENNKTLHYAGRQELNAMMIPAITMQGSVPRFYKIHMTKKLADAVQEGTCPDTSTTVFRHEVTVDDVEVGMRDIEQREEIVTCLLHFKNFVKD
ncbi:hypothetical protein BDR07DRAFT_1360065 [Suillus spraguei]|nr:hypothetical protein BDR07DRAFT_1360065 [Suillus spraguei]